MRHQCLEGRRGAGSVCADRYRDLVDSFSETGADCDYCDSSGANTPFQKVRVVTTVAYELD
ncbi:hypothetical protein DL238_10645 [Alteriqipengyuania lutimaris]|uniref:Uncharacterized protein n=1 Tax=Alteriqipengyuania lutimaris TaxID=1538146 RepID=A0A395LMB5_9SPHN|nr:hypothetical protein DL238_10645 [Alteriqipengyuania lutimaris]